MTDIWSQTAGEQTAPLVLLIHGSMDRSAGMLKLSRQLDQRFQVVRYDRRGYGRSYPHQGPFGMQAQVDDALHILDGRRALVVGHSYGGIVALSLAAHHGEQTVGVVVYESPLSWQPWWPGSTAGAVAVAAAGQPQRAAEQFMRRLIGDQRWDSLPESTRQTRRNEGIAMVNELADLRMHAPFSADQIRVPVVAGYGSSGAAHHRRGMEFLVDQLADAQLVEMANCRHDAPLSDAALFCSVMIDPLVQRVEPW